jgi:hypothetical protein
LGIGIVFLSVPAISVAQQFNGDNQWVAPHGVATLLGTAGEEYSQAILVAALLPEWEFNLVLSHYYDDPASVSDSYTATNLYVKRRLSENESGTAGYAIYGGTGVFPGHREQGEKMQAFDSWYAAGIATYAFADDKVLLDLSPGVVANLDQGPSSETAWGFTYTARLAVYGVLPRAALVGEAFGTAGDAESEPSYRLGLRWESPRWVVAATYSDAFDGSSGAGFELGFMYFTDPRFCFGGCKQSR